MTAYQVQCSLKEDGWWVAEVEEVEGCRVESRRLAFLPDRIRAALAKLVDDAATAELVLRVRPSH